METTLQEKDELVAKAKGKIGTLIEKTEKDGPKLMKPLDNDNSLLQKAKDKMHSSFKTMEEEGSSLLTKAKEKGSAFLGKAKDTMANSTLLKTIEQEGSTLLSKTKDSIKNLGKAPSDLLAKAKEGQLLDKSPDKEDSSLLAKAKETMENSFLMRTLAKSEGSLLDRAKEKVEKSLLAKTLKEGENFILGKAKETAEGAKKFSLLGAKPFNSLFSGFGSGTPKISGLKFLSIKDTTPAPIVEVDDFQYPPTYEEPKKVASPEVCYSRPPVPKEDEPVISVLPENKPLDYDKIDEGYYQDSRQFEEGPDAYIEYEEIDTELLPEELNRYSDEEDYYPEHYSEGLKGQKRHASYDRLFRRRKPKPTNEEVVRERFNRGIGHVKKLVHIAGQVDSFLTGKIRNSLKSLTHLVENEDDYKNGNR
ncbi:uncharacterized protein LOC129802773 [Phlebotomus papatasi]|uniref:uncharacterized protein LOC129802773 n=1 Tax=Phlebotomus papatasi TaxID=29031 RepID=UPI002483FB69|nr:uncharacterized protein LOC129802773 [Phlebotomus papatasi]